MDESRTAVLGELGAFTRGQGGTKKDARRAGLPCIRYGELYTAHDVRIRSFVSFIDPNTAHRYSELRSGDMIFAASGETHEEIGKGAVFVGDERAVAGADTIIFSPEPGSDPVFLSYASNRGAAARFKSRLGQGSSVIHIGARHLQDLPLWLPPLPEQRKIAEVLDTIDDAIRKTEEIITKLKRVKQGLLHDLLTRGIDDNGELRDPERHPEQFKDSPLGRIPQGWEVLPLVDCLISTPTNGIYKPASLIGRGCLLVGQTAFTADRSVDYSLARRAVVSPAEIERYGLAQGDVLVSRVFATLRGVGQPTLVPALPEPAVYESNMMRLRVDRSVVLSLLVFHCLRSRAVRRLVESGANISNQASINQKTLNGLPIYVPPQTEQRLIVARIDTLDGRRRAEARGLAKLALLKQGLMEDLLTGRVRVTPLLDEATE